MKLVKILLEDGRHGVATREDIDNGGDVPLRTRKGRPIGVNVKADDIIGISSDELSSLKE